MQRNVGELAQNTYDLLIIGGGIYGACVAWEATLRGLSVALVEKADFASATSANSLKTIHGGFRYLQHADLKRMRESICERRTLMQIAPHLIHPLPVLIPTYGHGIRSKEVLSVALALNDLISCDRNQIADPQKQIPRGRVISQRECLQLLPGINSQGLTGGAIFYDAQVYNSERLILSFLCSAAQAGADLANYVEVTGFLQTGDRIIGVSAQDLLTGNQFDIQAKTVVNTSGAWINQVLNLLQGQQPQPSISFAKAINLVTRQLFETYAVGISGQNSYQDADALIKKGSSLLFIAPWRGKSLIGTKYIVYDQKPDNFQVTEPEIQEFLAQVNQAYPTANLTRADVDFVHGGLLPSTGISPKTGDVQLAKHYQIYDYRDRCLQGLISVVGVKYTTARNVAEKVVQQILKTWGRTNSAVKRSPLYGGEIAEFDTFLHTKVNNRPAGISEAVMRRLIYNYGSAYPEVLKYLNQTATDELAVLKAEVLYGVREEMAQKLTDVVFRRTELATAGNPGMEVLQTCAETMSVELGWNSTRIQSELQAVNQVFAIGDKLSQETDILPNYSSG